jgi:cytochrome b561
MSFTEPQAPNTGAAAPGYTRTAKGLHWLMAVLIIGLLVLGIYMHELPLSPRKLQLYAWHKWAGVTVFVLLWLRLAWRISHRPPPLAPTLSARARMAAHWGHGLLYALMALIPLSGWLMSSAKGFQTVWFGVLPLPDVVGRNAALGDALQSLHQGLNLMLMLTLAGHIGAALWHHFIRRDDTLRRMR